MNDRWKELPGNLRGLRFSLATYVLTVLFLSAALATWVNRHPWIVVRSSSLPDFGKETPHLYPLGEKGMVLVHRPQSRHRLTTWNWHSGELESVDLPYEEVLLDVAPDVSRFLTTDKKGTARIRKVGLEQPLTELPHWVFPTAQNLRLSSDGNRVAGCGPDGAVWLYDVSAQKEFTFPTDSTTPSRVYLEFSQDAHWLQAHEVQSLDITAPSISWKLIDCEEGHRADVPPAIEATCLLWGPTHCTFAGTNNILFAGASSWRIGEEEMKPCPGQPENDGTTRSIALVHDRSHIEVWNKDLSARIGQVDLPPQHHADTLRVSPRGRHLTYLAFRDFGRATFLWSTVKEKIIHVFPNMVEVHNFLDSDHLLCIDARRGELQVWWRRRAESAWGILGQPEVWLALVFLAGTIVSIRRDQRRNLS